MSCDMWNESTKRSEHGDHSVPIVGIIIIIANVVVAPSIHILYSHQQHVLTAPFHPFHSPSNLQFDGMLAEFRCMTGLSCLSCLPACGEGCRVREQVYVIICRWPGVGHRATAIKCLQEQNILTWPAPCRRIIIINIIITLVGSIVGWMTGWRFEDKMRTTLYGWPCCTSNHRWRLSSVGVRGWMDGRGEFIKSCGCWNRKWEDVDMIGILWFGELCLKQIILIYTAYGEAGGISVKFWWDAYYYIIIGICVWAIKGSFVVTD